MQVREDWWARLLDVKRACDAEPESFRCVGFDADGYRLLDPDEVKASNCDAVLCTGPVPDCDRNQRVLVKDRLWLCARPGADDALIDTLMHYGPLGLAAAICPTRPFVIVHMAQSLDGMVCTEVGNSKWIGNEANLTHAHRLRALVDGVMVGGNTIRRDLPRLNVRHVPGNDPARLLLSDSFDDLDKLPSVEGGRTILLRSAERRGCDDPDCETVYFERRNGKTDIPALLEELHAREIRSILVEGGPQTFQSLLRAGAVDWLQLHVAPIVFGSGKGVVALPRIDEVDDAVSLEHPFYKRMGDAFMVTGNL